MPDRGRGTVVRAVEDLTVAHAVRDWAIAHGDDPRLRIALCGYDGEHAMPATWTAHRWKAYGGYGLQSDGTGRENARRETVWFSPHCLATRQPSLFEAAS